MHGVETIAATPIREKKSKIEKVVTYMNRFLDECEGVREKPFIDYESPTRAQTDALKEWCEEVRCLGRKASKRALEACDSERETQKRKLQPYVQGMVKRLGKVPQHKFVRSLK